MAHYVTCPYCGIRFNRDKSENIVQISPRRWAHVQCYAEHQSQLSQEEQDKNDLEDYIKSLFHIESLNARIQKQIKDYVTQQHYSYSGIKKSLVYFYEVRKNPIEKANGGIGIVPYIYQEAYSYYYNIWMARQTNAAKPIAQYIAPVERIIHILPPKRVEKKKKLFSFLDEEEEV